jgi:hypothetical protein
MIVHALPGIAPGTTIDLVAVVVVGCLVGVLWRGARRGDWPLEPATVATVLWAVPLFSNLMASQARYMLACWPFSLAMAHIWSRLPRAVRVAALVMPAALTIVLLRHVSLGLFTG